MSTPAIIEAAVRALVVEPIAEISSPQEYYRDLATRVLTAVEPLIEAAALEKAAKVAEGYLWKGDPNWIATDIRALKQEGQG